MFPSLLKKEIQDYLISVRFVVLMALCILLVPLSLYVNFETYCRWSNDYNEQVRTEADKGSRGRPQYSGLRPPSALSVFANGVETSLAKDFSIESSRIIFGSGRSFGDPIYETFGRIDFLFVVQAVLSLITFLFAFDAILRTSFPYSQESPRALRGALWTSAFFSAAEPFYLQPRLSLS